MINRILVPIDGSRHSKKTLALACDLAIRYDAGLHLLHIVQAVPGEYTLALGGAAVTIDADQEELKKAGAELMNSAQKLADEQGCRIAKAHTEGGVPAQKILNYASENKVDMIVMGSRGLSDLAGLLLGSVSHRVSHLAECTCVTVR